VAATSWQDFPADVEAIPVARAAEAAEAIGFLAEAETVTKTLALLATGEHDRG
jgi:hypothetical protein